MRLNQIVVENCICEHVHRSVRLAEAVFSLMPKATVEGLSSIQDQVITTGTGLSGRVGSWPGKGNTTISLCIPSEKLKSNQKTTGKQP